MSRNALKQYQAKRNFSLTPEPAPGGDAGSDVLSFVVQKHWASRLHYDFRLELDGAMKSWAVPKGPSFDSKIKRMAIQVEDHPISYASFEGTIPPRQYGAGKVIVWDAGTWQPAGNPRKGLADGNLKFALHGEKLHGRWVLVRMKGKSEKQPPWLLIKEKDEFVRPSAEFSVVDELPDSVSPATRAKKQKTRGPVIELPTQAVIAALPAKLAPQLATRVEAPPSDPQNWSYEIKFDGYRLLTRIEGAAIELFTRNGHDWTAKLASLCAVIAKLKLPSGWYDGELVMPNDAGVPDFGALQQAFESAQTDGAILYLFDLPYCADRDLRGSSLDARRAMLQELLAKKPTTERVRFSEVFSGPLASVLSAACKLGLEGVIAKRRDSPYVSARSTDWIKLKCGERQEFVVAGFTDRRGERDSVGALLLGVHDDDGRLRYAGKVGSGFSQTGLKALRLKLDALPAATSHFAEAPDVEGRPHWVQPKLVAEVSFGQWTRTGVIRHAVFQGLRSDKKARLIVREKTVIKAAKTPAPAKTSALASGLRVTHPDRVIDASTGVTKIELLRYYGLVADLMMEHLKDRPVSMLRAPDGVDGAQFFQKHAMTRALSGIRALDPALDPGHAALLAVATKGGLLSAAQWNVIEFHTLNGTAHSFDKPDRMVFDLDPGEGVQWPQMQEAAELVHAFLDQLGLSAYLKTSGGKGLHVVVPLRKLHDWDRVKAFSHAVVDHLARNIPQRFVAKSGPKNRVGKIFIDYLRNGRGASTVCAFSARARPGLGISVPVRWSELKSLRGGDHWTVRSAHTRLDTGNEAWSGYSKSARSLAFAMKLLAP